MNAHPAPALRRAQRGFSLIEIMIGLVIGLIAVLVIFQVYNVAEGFKRNTTAAGEAQMNGLFATFLLGMELTNGGAAIAVSGADLAVCPDTGDIATSFRPVPVLITDGGGNSSPDSFVVNYSIATTAATALMFNYKDPVAKTTSYNPGDPYNIQSPGGFHPGDLIVAINPGGPTCVGSKITAVAAQPAISINLYGTPTDVANVTITHTGTTGSFTGDGRPGLSTLFNMGPANRAQKVRYSVVNGVLYSTPLLDPNGVPAAISPNPLASNIVNMKVEYGIDSAPTDGLLDTWVQASDAGWDPATLLAAPLPTINQIKAIRIGFIVQSEQFDKNLAGFSGGDYVNGDYKWVLFDCNKSPKTLCPGRLTGTIAASTTPPGNWRFRKYETVIPLRNEIWNKAS